MGNIRNDNAVGAHRPSHFFAVKNFGSERHFTKYVSGGVRYSLPFGPSCRCSKWFPTILSGYSFLLLKKSNWLERIQEKNHHADAARDDGAKRVFSSQRRLGEPAGR
jgi:hypothetical protein